MQVIKRNKSKEDFDIKKILKAVEAAFESQGLQMPHHITKAIEKEFAPNKIKENLSVEMIQDFIEELLMKTQWFSVAKAFILYRDKRTILRNSRNHLTDGIEQKLLALSVQNSNANMDEFSFGGRMGEAASFVAKQYALDNLISPKFRDNHEYNEIYIHDLDSYAIGSHNCCTIPIDDLFAKGFNTRQTDVRAPKSLSAACQLLAVVMQLQSLQQFGGVSYSHVDWSLIPFYRMTFTKEFIKFADILLNEKDSIEVKKYIKDLDNEDVSLKFMQPELRGANVLHLDNEDLKNKYPKVWKLAEKQTDEILFQSIEALFHNLNTLQSRSGSQLPFSSICFGSCTLSEGKKVTKAILENAIKGVGKFHKTSIFPCLIFQIGKGINLNPSDPNYDLFQLALQSTAKRLYPNYVNIDWSNNAGYDPKDPRTFSSTMGCRTWTASDINVNKGDHPLNKDGRGNVCPVTIIMPTLAMKAEGDISKFLELLTIKIEEAKDMLIERYRWICSQSPRAAKFMYENGVLNGLEANADYPIESVMKHNSLAIGNIGLAETLQILIGKDHTSKEGMELAKIIYSLFKDKAQEFKQAYKLNFGVYNTPAEGLCYTSMKKFKSQFGEIPNVSDKEFFTNSMHVPVWKEMTPFEKIDIESQLTGFSNAGCITYVEIDSSVINNIQALEEIVKYAMEKDIPYFAINVPNDTCNDCGYCGDFNANCPKCNSSNINRLRRVTGYLTGDYKTAFNKGKQDEVEHRVKHIKKID